MSNGLEIHIARRVAVVWLAREKVRNAFNETLIAELASAFTRLGADDGVRAIVLAGRGPAFCAGADLDWMRRMAGYSFEENRADARALADMLRTINECPKPTVARVHGDAYAGGMGLVAACDIALGTPEAKFCLSEAKLGLSPATISPYVVRAMGERAARRYFLTAEVFDAEGYFHTGDIAEVDADDFIRITDRKKDIIVTAGGKNVAPQPIENELKRSPLVDNAVLIGDRRPYIVALLSPNEEELAKWAATEGIEGATVEELSRHPKLLAAYAKVVEATNENLARYEQIKKFEVLPLMLSIEAGHLTPTLKVKRRVIEERYRTVIDELYA